MGAAALMDGVDTIVHAAGRKGGMRTADFMRDNRDLPIKLYDLAKDAGVRRFIFISSATALLNLLPDPQTGLSEDTPANIHLNWAYAASKAQAEHGLLSRADLPGDWPALSIVRPCLIWGGDAPFHKRLTSGQLKLWGDAEQLHTTVHIDNLSEMMSALLAYEGEQRVFHPQDPKAVAFGAFCERLAADLGAAKPARASPALITLGATLAKLLIGLTFGRFDPGLQGVQVLFGRTLTTDDAATRQALNWRPSLRRP